MGTISRLSPFVGRAPELVALQRMLGDAARGNGGVALVGGEAGIGKSRLLQEFASAALRDGWLVLSGRAYDSEGMPPYLPFVEILRQYVRSCSDDELQPIVDNAPEIAALIPEILARFSAIPSRRPRSPESERATLFQGVTDFLLHAAHSSESRGLLICLDDLQWADRSTLLLFQHLARRLPAARICVAGTYRTFEVGEDHPLVAILADLKRERLYEGFALDALSPHEAASMVRLLTNRSELPPAFLEAVYHRTEGNPFFVEEVVRHLQGEGRDFDDPALAPGDWGLPEGARQVIGSGLARLSPEDRRLLQAAAVLGDEFSLMFPVVARMLAVDVSTLAGTMEDAVRAGMLRGDGKSYRFAHALIREAILQQMSLPRRQSLHLRAAEAVEEVYARDLEPRLPAIAAHYRLAGPFAEGEKAIDYSVRAGEAAETALAYDEAQLHWEAALDLMERHRVKNTDRVLLVQRLGELMQVVGFDNYDKSAGYFEQALLLHEKTGNAAGAAAMHARLGLLLGAGGPINDNLAALRHLQAAATLLKDGPASDAQLSFYSALGLVAVWQVHTKDGLASSGRAMEIALELGEEDRWVTNAVMHSYHLHAEGRLRDGFELMTRAWETANRLNNTYRAFVAALWLGSRLLELGDPLEARAWYQKEVAQPRQVHAPTRRRALQRGIAATFASAGDMESCQRILADEGIRTMPEVAFFDGSWDEAEAAWTREREAAAAGLDRSSEATAEYWLARVRRLRGDASGAIGLLSDALATGLDGPSLLVQLMASAELAIVLAESGRPEKSEVHLARCREILAEGEDWRGLAGRVALAEAVHAAASGCGANASERFELAIGVFRRLSLPWDEAEAFEIRARSCKRFYRGRTRRAFLLETLDSARAVYERIGAGQPWLDRLDAYGREVMGVADDHARDLLPDHLTPREAEVLRLIAAGKSGKEIGAELVLSVRTVERHIANIYLKTDLHGRAQVANYAISHGLSSPNP